MKKLALFAAILVSSFSLMLAPVVVHAQSINDELCKGIGFTEGEEGATDCSTLEEEDAEGSVANIINTIINIFSIVVGAVSVIMIILGGLRYITSSGDSTNVTAAKNTILYAVVGLVIVIFAQTVVKFVVSRLAEGADG